MTTTSTGTGPIPIIDSDSHRLMRKVLWENAARLYRIHAPPGATV